MDDVKLANDIANADVIMHTIAVPCRAGIATMAVY